METELWPTLFRHCRRRGIPVIIANARLSPRSLRGYSRIPALVAATLADCQAIAAQTRAHARRFQRLGAAADRVSVIGNIKFDLAVPEAQTAQATRLRNAFGAERPVWVAVSTHEGEERAALEAHRLVLQSMPSAVLILVPRHPQRFDEISTLAERSGLRTARRSNGIEPARLGGRQIFIGDSMGEMFMYLAASDLAFVGGSLVDIGGHNVLEPAAIGLPVVFGPHMHNFSAARSLLLECGAALQVESCDAFTMEIAGLLGDPPRRERMGRAGRQAVAANRGALDRLLAIIETSAPPPAKAVP
jgi:3-deoxy-D-manno-octulosonic-acid transferase